MKIAGRTVGNDYPPLLIAEVGINHGGELSVAKKLAELAAGSGCEVIKHQTHFVEDEMTEEAKNIIPPNADRSIWEIISECSLNPEEEKEFKEYSESLGLIWISTPFSRKAADFLADLGVPAFKIGSGEADNLPLIEHIAAFGKPIILSTGMHSVSSLKRSVQIIDESRVPYALLECTNLYPCPPDYVSLRGLKELQDEFPTAVVGFSDHSIGPEMAIASVALGASIVERHFTDTRYRDGPDIRNSMDPAELRLLVDRFPEIWKATLTAKQRSGPEEVVYRFARASVVADRDLFRGDVISGEDIWVRRPGTGSIPAREFDQVIGRKLLFDIKKNIQLSWEFFE